jgi:hypothetical protein
MYPSAPVFFIMLKGVLLTDCNSAACLTFWVLLLLLLGIRFIWITGWSVWTDTLLTRKPMSNTNSPDLGELLRFKAAQGVKVGVELRGGQPAVHNDSVRQCCCSSAAHCCTACNADALLNSQEGTSSCTHSTVLLQLLLLLLVLYA